MRISYVTDALAVWGGIGRVLSDIWNSQLLALSLQLVGADE